MTKDTQYTAGELVDVQIKGAVVVSTDDMGGLYVQYASGGSAMVDPAARGVTVTRLWPASGPPQLGDVWTRGIYKYFVADDNGTLWLVPAVGAGGRVRAEVAQEVLGSLELVYREGWSPTPAGAVMSGEVDRVPYVELLSWIGDNVDAGLPLPAAIHFHADGGVVLQLSSDTDSRGDVDDWAVVLRLPAATLGQRYDGEKPWQCYETAGTWGGHPVRIWDSVTPELDAEAETTADAEQLVAEAVAEPETTKTPAEWLAELKPGYRILDWDGWAGHDVDEPITADVFQQRFNQCTITGPVGVPDVTRCPACGSEDPRLHLAPETLCLDPFHGLKPEVSA